MKAKLLLMVVLLPFVAVAAQGYKIVHPDGTVEFTDQPAKNAEEVDLPGVQGYQSTGAAAPASGPAATAPQIQKGGDGYLQISITSPQTEQTLSGTGGAVSVAVAVSPELQAGHQVVISLDGREVARGESTSFSLVEVERGAHLLGASIIDATGATLKQADPITFYIFQQSLLKPPRK